MEFAWYGSLPWPPVWSSGQNSCLQIRSPGFDSRHYQKNRVVGLEGVHSASWVQLRSYLKEKSGSCLENREYFRRYPSRWPRGTLYLRKLAITSPTSGGRSVGIVRSRTQTWSLFLVGFPIQMQRNKPFIVFSHTPLCSAESICYRKYIVKCWPRPAIMSPPWAHGLPLRGSESLFRGNALHKIAMFPAGWPWGRTAAVQCALRCKRAYELLLLWRRDSPGNQELNVRRLNPVPEDW
jgi:hypothetical protein